MKKLSNPRDLLIAQLSELLWVERRLAFDVLPHLVEQASDEPLSSLFEEHRAQTQEHERRVAAAFRELGIEPSSALSPGLSGLIEQHSDVGGKIVEPGLRDKWHAAAGIAAEHFEIALYTAIEPLAPDEVRKLLAPNLKDEQAALKKLAGYLV